MKVTIITTNGSKSEIQSTATTWGELKSELRNAQIETTGMKAILGSTRSTLELNDSILPQEDFKIFLCPEKVKSGGNEEVAKEIERVKGKLLDLNKEIIADLDSVQDSLIGNIKNPYPQANSITVRSEQPKRASAPVARPVRKSKRRSTRASQPSNTSSASQSEMDELYSILNS